MDNRAYHELNNVKNKFRKLEHSDSLKYDDFFEIFGKYSKIYSIKQTIL